MKVDREPDSEDLVSILSSALGARQLYFRDHPNVRSSASAFTGGLERLLEVQGKDAFFIGLVEGKLVLDGRLLVGPTILGSRLVEFLSALRGGGMVFRKALDEEEFIRFLDAASETKDPFADLEEGRRFLRMHTLPDIELSPPYEDAGWFGQFFFEGREEWDDGSAEDPKLDEHLEQYRSLFDSVDSSHAHARAEEGVDIAQARTTSESLINGSEGGITDILRLVRYPDYDTFTVGHSVRVALLAVLTAQRAGLPREVLTELGAAGLLHDVGKALIPDEIIFKPGRLDEGEFRQVARHPVLGAGILLDSADASSLSIGAAWGHHLRHDGGGYPPRTAWAIENPLVELIHVCDVFEAITAIRPYKTGMTPRRAFEIMLEDRSAFDPTVLRWFVRAMGMYPPGHMVGLASGEVGLVLRAGDHVERPTIRVTHDRGGRPILRADQPTLDLATPEASGRQIVGFFSTGSEPGLSRRAA
jgi:HD-GYP domain-containing protein (c-di-GMP phosphodiesterase class II)